MSRTKGHSRSAITGSGGRGWDARFEPARGCPAPAFWLASAGGGRRWRGGGRFRNGADASSPAGRRRAAGRMSPRAAPKMTPSSWLSRLRRPSIAARSAAAVCPAGPAQASARASRSVLAQVARGGQDAGEQFPGRGVRLDPPAAAADELAGLGDAGLPGRVAGGVPVPAGRGILRLAERVVQAGSRRSAGGEQVADGRWTARPPRPGRGSAAAAAGVTRRTAPGRGWSARRAVAVPRGGTT